MEDIDVDGEKRKNVAYLWSVWDEDYEVFLFTVSNPQFPIG